MVVAEIVGGPEDGAPIKDVSRVELRASQVEREGVVYVLCVVHDGRLRPGLKAYHPCAVRLIRKP